MGSDRKQGQGRSIANFQAQEWPEKMKLSEACKFLGISPSKMSTLISSATIKFEVTPLDHRIKLVKRADLEELKNQYSKLRLSP
jgi:hypothetical protein